MRDTKQSLRVRARLCREAFSSSELLHGNRAIAGRVLCLPVYLCSKSVALYSPIGNEVDTRPICDHALGQGKRVFYPKLSQGESCLAQVESCEDLQPGPQGIREPVGANWLTAKDHDGLVLFIPGLAFDLQGNRLGRGRGWYDRVLVGLGTAVRRVALAYEFQIMEGLPVEEWDQKVHQIITEKRIIDCGNLESQSGYVF